MSTERVKRDSAKAPGYYKKLNSVGREAEVDMDPDQVPKVDASARQEDSEGTSSNQDGSSSPSASSSGSASSSSSSGSDASDSKSDSDTTQNDNKESEKPVPSGKPAPTASKVVDDADSKSKKKESQPQSTGQSRSRARGKNTQVLRTVSSPPGPPSVHIVDITMKAGEGKIDSDSFDEPEDIGVEVKKKRRSIERRRSPSPLGSPRHVTPEKVVDSDPDDLKVESPDTSRRRAIEAIRANNEKLRRDAERMKRQLEEQDQLRERKRIEKEQKKKERIRREEEKELEKLRRENEALTSLLEATQQKLTRSRSASPLLSPRKPKKATASRAGNSIDRNSNKTDEIAPGVAKMPNINTLRDKLKDHAVDLEFKSLSDLNKLRNEIEFVSVSGDRKVRKQCKALQDDLYLSDSEEETRGRPSKREREDREESPEHDSDTSSFKRSKGKNPIKSGKLVKSSRAKLLEQVDYPHAFLNHDYISADIEYDQLDFPSTVAGEIEVWQSLDLKDPKDLSQLAFRMEMLKVAAYNYQDTKMEGIRQFLDALFSKIEKGQINWGRFIEIDRAENRILRDPKHRVVRGKDKEKRQNNSSNNSKKFYCYEFNIGKCNKGKTHEGKLGDRKVTFSHICRACYGIALTLR